MFKVNYDRLLSSKRNPKIWFAFFPINVKMYYFFQQPIEQILALDMGPDHAENIGRIIAVAADSELDDVEVILRKVAVAPDDVPLPMGATLTVRCGDEDETILHVALTQ